MMNNFDGLPKKSPETGFINQEEILLFGKKLRESREKSKKLLIDLIGMIGVSEASCYAWERGTSFPSSDKLGRIAVAYGIEGQDYNNLIEAFEISKQARENEKKSVHPRSKESLSGFVEKSPINLHAFKRGGSK